MRRVHWRTALPWAGLAGVLCIYVLFVVRLHPTNFFGYTHDDSIYFSSAQALAEGRGYVLPSLPGAPEATKYPVLLPWLLSFVWRWNPSFPNNLPAAIGVIVAFGCAFLASAFAFLRKYFGLSGGEALCITAFCALQPIVLLCSSSLLSDIPFAALAMAALLVWGGGLKHSGNLRAAASGILSGLSILMRLTGLPFAAGVLLFAVWKRAWRLAGIYAASAGPFAIAVLWRAFMAVPPVPPSVVASPGPGWQQTWLYYTNYGAFRRMASPDLHTAATFLLNQSLYLISEISGYLLSPLSDKSIAFWLISTVLITWMVLAGLVRQAKQSGWQPAHFALAGTVLAVLSWDYPDGTRFLIPFLPIFMAAFWIEAKAIARRLRDVSRGSRELSERLAARAGLAAGLVVFLAIGWNFVHGDREKLREVSVKRAELLREKREAYGWIRRNSSPGERVIASEDAMLYLYTDRETMRPIELLPNGAYDPARLSLDLEHVTDVAGAIGATYWLASPNDSDTHWKASKRRLAARLSEVEGVLPELFTSSGGQVSVYGLGCVRSPNTAGCQAADRILFPDKQRIGNAATSSTEIRPKSSPRDEGVAAGRR